MFQQKKIIADYLTKLLLKLEYQTCLEGMEINLQQLSNLEGKLRDI